MNRQSVDDFQNSETILFDTVRVDTSVKQMSYIGQNL